MSRLSTTTKASRLGLALLAGMLVLWICALAFLDLSAGDLFFRSPGRERWFAIVLNMACLLAVAALAFAFRKTLLGRPKKACALPVVFAGILIATGFWIPLVAAFTGPPWGDQIVKIPFSAATPYMYDVWAWRVGPEAK